MSYSIFDVAKHILNSCNNVSHKKLQKLCYYVYSWYVYLNNDNLNNIKNRLFKNDFEAWVHGPVSKSLYRHLKDSPDIFNIKTSDIKESTKEITEPEVIKLINNVLKTYSKYTADGLESISHQETPWLNARKGKNIWDNSNTIISDKDIFIEYSRRS